MSAKITLTITAGNLKGEKFIFEERTTCIIGRAIDCNPRLPDDENHRTISRYHCLLDINPPNICARDFGSKNGTFVNGKKIGQRSLDQTPSQCTQIAFPEYDLKDGDELKLGETVFQVNIAVAKDNNETLTAPGLHLLAHANERQFPQIQGYEIVEELGKGGMGKVYLARNNKTEKFVALKVMRSHVAANPRQVNWFAREIENTKALNHPNIVRVEESGYSENTFFFTLEYCNGGNLIELLQQRGGYLLLDEAMPIILQILDGLEYAHNADIPYVKLKDGSFSRGRGLVHRDLKPANIFLSNINGTRTAKIGDYGLAKAFDLAGLSGQTLTGTIAGTPFYMPRQQVIDFKYAKPEVDVWAAAACFYYMLTGTVPRNFVNLDPFIVVLQTNAVPIRDRAPSLPPSLAKAIDLALIDNPEISFKTAAEFKQALLNT